MADEVRRQLAARGIGLGSVVDLRALHDVESQALLFAVTYRA